MSEKTTSLIVMTGATSGIGLKAARALGERENVHLIVGARAPERANALRAAVPEARLTVLPLDTSSLASVRAFADAVNGARGARQISALALNAGIQGGRALNLTGDGVEQTFATNVLGHYALVDKLRPALSPGAAVVITASQSHNPADIIARLLLYRGGIFRDAAAVARGKLHVPARFSQAARDRYATSKLCCILYAFAMARRVPGDEIRFLAYDPGAVPATRITRHLGLFARAGWALFLPLLAPLLPGFTTPQASGRALARILADPGQAPQTGQYLNHRLKPASLWAEAKRTDWQDDLMTVCAALTASR